MRPPGSLVAASLAAVGSIAIASGGGCAKGSVAKGYYEPPGGDGGSALIGSSSETTAATTTTTTTSGAGGAGGDTTTTTATTGAGGAATTATTTAATTTSGAGGAGGAAVGSGGSGGSGGQGGEGGSIVVPGTGTLLLAAVGANGSLMGEYHAGDEAAWITAGAAEKTTSSPSLAITSALGAVAVVRSSPNGGMLRWSKWSAGFWSVFQDVGPAITTHDTPHAAALSGVAHVAFLGDDFKHYYAAFDAGAWSPAAAPIGGAAAQAFGPTPATVLVVNGKPTAVYAGNDGGVYEQRLDNGAQQPAVSSGVSNLAQVTPAAAELTTGPDLLVVFARKTDQQLVWMTRTGAAWTAPATISGAFTPEPPVLTPIVGGDAALVFRGGDQKIYWARYTNGGAWSAVKGVVTPNLSIKSPPALVRGVGGAEAEAAYVDAAVGAVHHVRLEAGVWSAPIDVGGSGLSAVGLASDPE
jgi:hypothetical protein